MVRASRLGNESCGDSVCDYLVPMQTNMKTGFKTMITIASLLVVSLTATAQTNRPVSFQGYAIGAAVHVRADKPLILLNRATVKEINESNIVVDANGNRFVLDKRHTELSDPVVTSAAMPQSAAVQPSIAPAPGNIGKPSAAGQDIDSMQAEAQQAVLGKYVSDTNYSQAVAQYQSMMGSFRSGKMSLADLAAKAEKVLAEADKYQPERKSDPEYESQIATLRDFVRRVKAGEQVKPPAVD